MTNELGGKLLLGLLLLFGLGVVALCISALLRI